MITPEQIKAARAWIDWSRDALAHESGLSPETIRNLEKGKVSRRSAEGVRIALENRGFRFHGNNGLSRHIDESWTYEGPGSSEAFYDDLRATIERTGGPVAATFKTQDQFARSLGITGNVQHLLEYLSGPVTIKCLLSEERELNVPMPGVQFRAVACTPLGPFGTFVFGDKVAVVITNGIDFTFHVMKSVPIAKDSWREFLACWESALLLVTHAPTEKRA